MKKLNCGLGAVLMVLLLVIASGGTWLYLENEERMNQVNLMTEMLESFEGRYPQMVEDRNYFDETRNREDNAAGKEDLIRRKFVIYSNKRRNKN